MADAPAAQAEPYIFQVAAGDAARLAHDLLGLTETALSPLAALLAEAPAAPGPATPELAAMAARPEVAAAMAQGALRESIEFLKAIDRRLDAKAMEDIRGLVKRGDAVKSTRWLRERFFG